VMIVKFGMSVATSKRINNMTIDVTRKELEHVAIQLNIKFKYKPEEQIDVTVDDVALMYDIKNASEEFLREDQITSDVEAILLKMGAKTPNTVGVINLPKILRHKVNDTFGQTIREAVEEGINSMELLIPYLKKEKKLKPGKAMVLLAAFIQEEADSFGMNFEEGKLVIFE